MVRRPRGSAASIVVVEECAGGRTVGRNGDALLVRAGDRRWWICLRASGPPTLATEPARNGRPCDNILCEEVVILRGIILKVCVVVDP